MGGRRGKRERPPPQSAKIPTFFAIVCSKDSELCNTAGSLHPGTNRHTKIVVSPAIPTMYVLLAK